MIVEGELNLLAIQSVAVHTAKDEGGSYANWVGATGSSCTVDTKTIKALLDSPEVVPLPVVIQDNDEAGHAMVNTIRRELSIHVVIPPVAGQDIEDFLRAFGADYQAAFQGLAALLKTYIVLTRPFAAVANEIFEIRQKFGKEDFRRDHEINSAVRKLLHKDMVSRGRFYHDQCQQTYFFDNECKSLISLSNDDGELSIYLANYGLNPTEKCFAYIGESLKIESRTNGDATRVHRFCYYDAESFTLYVTNHGSGAYRVTADSIELVDNGTDGVLFLRNRKNEPYELADGVDLERDGDLFQAAVIEKINFAEDGRLEIAELQALVTIWFFATFFGSILPTRALLAFIGPKGSGKSHTLRKFGVLLFGSQFDVVSLPDKEDSFDAVTTNSHLACFDNADSKVEWLPDRLAICATRGEVNKRVLFTTNTLVSYQIDCFLGITSRTPYFQRDDVADRLLVFHVRRFGEGEFIAEGELLAEILAQRNGIMTIVFQHLQGVIGALKETNGRKYKTSFRIADLGVFALRVADAQGGMDEMQGIFDRMRDEQAAFTLEGDTVIELLDLWLKDEANIQREVSAAQLYGELAALSEKEKIEFGYKSSRSLGQRLGNTEHNCAPSWASR